MKTGFSLVGAFLWITASLARGADPLAVWTMDGASNLPGQLNGFHDFMPGVKGQCLVFDGFTTKIDGRNKLLADLDGAKGFALRAWVSLGAYPWNWVPIIEQGRLEKTGFSFGIDSNGRFGLGIELGGQWIWCRSEIRQELASTSGPKVGLDLRHWYDLVAVYQPGKAISIFQDGKLVKSVSVNVDEPAGFDLQKPIRMGAPGPPLPASYPVRSWATFAAPYSLDGAVDELAVYDCPLTAEEIAALHQAVIPENDPPFGPRDLPTVTTTGPAKFGAFATTLKYYPQWDRLWGTKVTDHADVVVTFDELPVKVVYWRGTRYSPCWVSENNKWLADQSREVGGNWGAKRPWQEEPTGCIEHMQDNQCRSARVQIIENTAARVVVEWVYAQMDALLRYEPDAQGWPLWGRERYTIYPDGVAVRHVLPGEGGWQETIFLNAAGTRPEDNVEAEALTLVTLEGKTDTYSWAAGYPEFKRHDAPIQMIRFKSLFKPFLVFMPGSGIKCFNVERRPDYSIFPWWNHWPVAMIASDGRHCQAADRASHSSLAWGSPLGDCALYGMTDQPAQSLVALAKSWSNPPKLTLVSGTVRSVGRHGYVPQQRAYELELSEPLAEPVELRIAASPQAPLCYPAFVIRNWDDHCVTVEIAGKPVPPGKDLRVGFLGRLGGTDLVIWIKRQSVEPLSIRLSRVAQPRPAGK